MRWGLWSPACEPRRRYADGICTRLLRARLGENECLLRRTAPWEVEVPFFVTWPSNAMLLRRMPGFVSGCRQPGRRGGSKHRGRRRQECRPNFEHWITMGEE